MAVPDARVELQIAGVWTDTEDDLLHSEGIRYSWGRRGEGARTDPAAATFALRNVDGKYSSRNPNSPYFGQLGRNTPVRLSHGGAAVALVIPSGIRGRASTPDHASLDITADIDLRMELTPSSWSSVTSSGGFELAGKYVTTGGQRSWLWDITDGGLPQFFWSVTGSDIFSSTSSVPAPFEPRTLGAVRVTLDVNNGSGGWTCTHYTAPTISGPWTQLSQAVTTSGTTSIFNSSAPVEVGDVALVGFNNTSRYIHAFEMRSGISGSVVANPDFTAQPSGTTAFADAAGRTWTAANGGEITSRRIRAVLEASEWSPQWGSSGHDVTTPVVAAGILRRLGQGDKALASTLRRRIPAAGAPKAYWPMEEGVTATQAYSPVAGVAPLTVTGFEWAADGDLLGSSSLPRITNAARMIGTVPTYTGAGEWMVACVYNLPTAPVTPITLLEFTTTGTARRIVLDMNGAGAVGLNGYSASGATVFTAASLATEFHGQWNRLELTAVESGGNTEFHLGWVVIGGTGYGPNTTVAATAGTVTGISTTFSAAAADLRIGHLGIFGDSTTTVYIGGDTGWNGETASARMLRLTAEEGVPSAAVGQALTLMGPQRPDVLLDLLGECESSDDGILYEDRDRAGLVYRARTTLYNQTPKLVIPYGQLAPPLQPVDDDRQIRNDRTVTRIGGSSARAVLDSGALSVAAPPSGVGTYDDAQTLSLATDAQCEGIAHWLLHRGTWDESRYPSVRIYLHKYPELIPAAASLQPGDVIRITDLPEWLPPGPLDLLVEGGSEEIKTLAWTITLACSPAGPWTVGVTNTEARADTGGCTLGSDITSTATSAWSLVSPGSLWVTSSGRLTANPDLEVSVGNWTAVGGTISRVATPAAAPFGGSWSMQLVPNGVSSLAYAESDAVAVSVGTTYLAHAWVQCATSRNVQLRIGWKDAGGALLSVSTISQNVNAGEWTELSGTGVAPASTVTATVFPLMASTPAASDVLLADVVMLATPTSNAIEFPILLDMAGEHVLLRTCTGTSSPQTGGGLRSQNGIVKAQAAGAAIRLAHPTIVAL